MTPKEFEENFVFEKYKDTSFRSCKHFKKEVMQYRNIDTREVYTKIVNYQIKNYGEALTLSDDPHIPIEKLNFNARTRNKSRKITRGIYENQKEKRWRVYE